jgi:ribosomal protein S18 acetylase RimI-like enzyme
MGSSSLGHHMSDTSDTPITSVSHSTDPVRAIFDNQTAWLFRLATGSIHPPASSTRLWHRDHLQAARTGRTGVILSTPSQENSNPKALDQALDWLDSSGCGDVLIWSAQPDLALDRQLQARGARDSFAPHWMWRDLERRLPPFTPPENIDLSVATAADLTDLLANRSVPYVQSDQLREMLRLTSQCAPEPLVWIIVARETHRLRRSTVLGLTVVNLLSAGDDKIAGLFNLGVDSKARQRGIGTALTLAALALARDHGALGMGLNATPDGERVYWKLGFHTIGHGQTWFLPSVGLRHRPPADLVEQAEALASGATVGIDPAIARVRAMPNGETPITFAARYGHQEAARWLIHHGAKADILSLWKLGLRDESIALMADRAYLARVAGFHATTPLHDAVDLGDLELVEQLLRAGADLSARDGHDHATPLDWARVLHRSEIEALLTVHDPNLQDR